MNRLFSKAFQSIVEELDAQQRHRWNASWCGHIATPSGAEPCPYLVTPAEAEAEGETQNSGCRWPGETLTSRRQRPHGIPTAEAGAEGQTQNSGCESCGGTGRADLSMEKSLSKVFQSAGYPWTSGAKIGDRIAFSKDFQGTHLRGKRVRALVDF